MSHTLRHAHVTSFTTSALIRRSHSWIKYSVGLRRFHSIAFEFIQFLTICFKFRYVDNLLRRHRLELDLFAVKARNLSVEHWNGSRGDSHLFRRIGRDIILVIHLPLPQSRRHCRIQVSRRMPHRHRCCHAGRCTTGCKLNLGRPKDVFKADERGCAGNQSITSSSASSRCPDETRDLLQPNTDSYRDSAGGCK
jgi:hypothetical protein